MKLLPCLPKTLKSRVTLLSLAVFLVSIWSLVMYAGYILRHDLKHLLGVQQLSTTTLLAEDVNHEIEFRLASLEQAAAVITPAIIGNPERLQECLQNRLILQNIFNGGMYAVGPDGTTLADIPRSTGRTGMNVSGKEWFVQALSGAPAIGKPVIGRMLKVPVFTMAVPVRAGDGTVIGVLAGVVDLSRPSFLDKIAGNRYGITGDYLLVAPRHRLIVTSSDRRRVMEELPAPGRVAVLDRFMQGHEGSEILRTPEGVETLMSVKRVPAAEWYVATLLPTDEAYAPMLALQRNMLVAAAILTAFSGLLTWWLLRRQLSPLVDAVTTMSRLSGTDQPMPALPVSGTDEVGQLITAFNRLLRTLAVRENRLIESEERHKSILTTAMSGFWLADEQGLLLEVNDSYCRMSGYRKDELLAMNIAGLEAVESAGDVAERIQDLKRTGSGRFESQHRRKDGTLMDVEVSVQFRQAEGGQCVAFIEDITERKRVERVLKEALLFNRQVINCAQEGIIVHDLDLRYLVWNPFMERLTGMAAADVIGSHPVEVFPFVRETGSLAQLEQALEGKNAPGGEFRFAVAATGKSGWTFNTAATLRTEAGKIIGVIRTIRDISEHRKLEEQLRQSQKMEALGQLAGGVAHDFNNILQIIMGYANLMAYDAAPGQQEQLREIMSASERAAELTSGLLSYSRKQVFKLKPTDINALIGSIEKFLRRVLGEDVELSLKTAPGPLVVIADTSHTQQVFVNLASNARDAMPSGGRLNIQTERVDMDEEFVQAHGFGTPGPYVLVSVSDTGTGIPKEQQQNIFEPFFTTKQEGKGSGLGLAIVYGIVTQHHGFITCCSEQGVGTAFRIYLPLAEGAIPRAEPAALTVQAGSELTILLAEDEPSVRTVTRHMLERHGYSVIEAAHGREAVEIFRQSHSGIHLVVLDALMPEMNGVEALAHLRSIDPGVRCIFLSGYARDIISGRTSLPDDVEFINKPVVPARLLEAVARAVQVEGRPMVHLS